ncbi:DMT family transporter [Fusibacter ferrireducens]|uniref:DMT family transporter n=1 Tax=Fusibacter ferrireducens TaxID=2785058 RepID=A0ABR9ZZT4_9FIRM|nr:DMT family transporter [Fusibacter ferrireducens]MBF4695415.1 DMT family transporter [Fusibacter ferrireducens]
MAYSSAYITGLLLALMVSFNGMLSNYTSTYFSSFIFNAIGLILFAILLLRPSKLSSGHMKPRLFWLLLPGALSALTIVMSNITVAQLGITIMVGISLLGQVLTSLVIDGLGLLGKPKTKITLKQIIGICIIFVGVYLLL